MLHAGTPSGLEVALLLLWPPPEMLHWARLEADSTPELAERRLEQEQNMGYMVCLYFY